MNIYWTIYITSIIIIVAHLILAYRQKRYRNVINDVIHNVSKKFVFGVGAFLLLCPVMNTIIAVQSPFKFGKLL